MPVGGGQDEDPLAPKAGVVYSLAVQPDGGVFVRALGSRRKSIVIGPFEDEAAAQKWISEHPAPPSLKRRRPARRSGKK